MRELDLLAKYPKGKRDPAARAAEKTPEDIAIARKFGREFFDGERRHGYGGYSADAERWRGVVHDLIATYGEFESFLDIGCGKGGLVRAVKDLMPECDVQGCDISKYAITQARFFHASIADAFWVCDVRDIHSALGGQYDLVVSINTIHNLPRFGVLRALENIERMGKQKYITVDSYRTYEEMKRMNDWNLTALTILPPEGWQMLFKEAGYTGDVGYWVP